MSKTLSLESLTKKLINVTNTQDSIPMFSLWIIHHKAHHELIVNTWLEILKTSKPKHRLTLLYLANDVVQSCKRKKADIFKEDFANILPEAISFLRDKFILPGVERVLKVWMNRNIYDAELIDQLHAALLTNRPPDTLRQKLLAEYKTSSLIDAISRFKKDEDAIVVEEKQLKNIHVDASSSDNIHKLKDKVGGEIFSRNFEESATNIERFIVQYEKFVEERKCLLGDLSQGEVFYRAQYHEAKIVVNAYQSFDARVSKMKKLLDQVKLKFSPKTPTLESNANSDVADMDMSDSDQELGNKPSKIVAVDTNRNAPVKSVNAPKTSEILQPTQQTGTFVKRPGMRGASTSSLFSSTSPLKAPPANINIPVSFNGALSAGIGSKVSTPSASPPSPEGSPDLNISSPPRYPSLESRLADLFSGGTAKVNLRCVTENTGSESDADSITIAAKHASPKGDKKNASDSTLDTTKEAKETFSIPKSEAVDISWQNSIPVIGGNRRSSRETNFMDSHRTIQPGGSTPLQDESNSEAENFQIEKFSSSCSKSVESVLPPPSFSGDALHFLTKFMGQQTNTTLSQALRPSSTQPMKSGSTDVLQNLNIDWNSIQNITASVGRWPPPPNASAFTSAAPKQQAQAISQVSREHDTDYRTTGKNARVVSNDGVTSNAAASQFRDILRKKSSEPIPNYAPSSDDVIVEEEEILVDDDSAIRPDADVQNKNKVHLNNLKNIPTVIGKSISPPPISPANNLSQFGGQKRLRDEDFRQRTWASSRMLAHHTSRGRPAFPLRHRMPPSLRMSSVDQHHQPIRGPFRPRMPHMGERFTGRQIPRNRLNDAAFTEDEYYDMLYDELRPKYSRPTFGNQRPRKPYH